MFDFSVWELSVVGLVALVVIGPERLPEVARGLGRLWQKALNTVHTAKSEVDQVIAVEDLKTRRERATQFDSENHAD